MSLIKILNQTKIALIIILILCITPFDIIAQELLLKEFKQLKDNTTARINRKRDINGQNCAVLIIKYNFKDFTVETGKDYEALEEKIGETWVWLSPDEYRIVIRKEGYIPFSLDLKNKLESLETYELIVTDGYGSVKVKAPDAQIWLDEKLAGKDNYSFTLKEGKYILKATRDKYYEEEKFVVLNAGDNLKYNFNLKPKMGSLKITSTPSNTNGADIYINDSLNAQKTNATISLIIGNFSVRIDKKGFLPYNKDVNIFENQITQLNAQMETDPTLVMMKHKKKKNIWLVSSIVTAGIGGYFYLQSNKLYNEYQTAGTNAADIHKKIETYDIIAPVAFALAGFCIVEFIIHTTKYGKAKRKLKLHTSYTQNGGTLSLSYAF